MNIQDVKYFVLPYCHKDETVGHVYGLCHINTGYERKFDGLLCEVLGFERFFVKIRMPNQPNKEYNIPLIDFSELIGTLEKTRRFVTDLDYYSIPTVIFKFNYCVEPKYHKKIDKGNVCVQENKYMKEFYTAMATLGVCAMLFCVCYWLNEVHWSMMMFFGGMSLYWLFLKLYRWENGDDEGE